MESGRTGDLLATLRNTLAARTPHLHLPLGRRPLTLWALAWALLCLHGGLFSWHWFATAGSLVGESGQDAGWHLFAAHPELQFGPVSVLAAWLLTRDGVAMSYPLAALAMLALGALALAALTELRRGAGRPTDGRDWRATLFLLVPGWMVLALHYGHLDDALALTLACVGIVALQRRHRLAATVLLALATDAKPWLLPLGLVLVLLAGDVGGRRERLRALSLHLGLLALPWLPFLLADRGTLALGSFKIQVASDSVLQLVSQATSTPGWTRPAQLLLALASALWCTRNGRWAGVPLVVVASRMVLDPQTYGYYASGLLLAALLLDATSRRRWRGAAVLGWWLLTVLLDGPLHAPLAAAGLRLVAMSLFVAIAVHGPAAPARAVAADPRRARSHTTGATSTVPTRTPVGIGR